MRGASSRPGNGFQKAAALGRRRGRWFRKNAQDRSILLCLWLFRRKSGGGTQSLKERDHSISLASWLVASKGVANGDIVILGRISERKHVGVCALEPVLKALLIFSLRSQTDTFEGGRWPARLVNQIERLQRVQGPRDQALRNARAGENLCIDRRRQATIAVTINQIKDCACRRIGTGLICCNGHVGLRFSRLYHKTHRTDKVNSVLLSVLQVLYYITI